MARKKKEEVKEIKKGIKAKQEDIEVMSLDNKPITKEVTKEPIQVHDKFASVPPKKVDTKKTINVTCADGTSQPYYYYVANIYNDFKDFIIQFEF